MAVRQLTLLELSRSPAGLVPGFDPRFERACRIDLGRGAWIEHVPGWVRGDGALFDHLEASMRWRAERRVMYERMVDVPRLLARPPDDGPGHPVLAEMASALAGRYRADFDRTTLALYRTGQDSVAWHRDHDHRDRESSVVAVASLGGPRRFLVRPRAPARGITRSFLVGAGDLLVMGGSSQRTVEHTVPKARHAPPRIAIMFRHTEPIAPTVRRVIGSRVMKTKLPTQSFVALAAVAWADGRRSKNEAAGLLRAARELGLSESELQSVETATKEKVAIDAFDAAPLSSWERLLTYGLASWIARLDGVTQSEEIASLRALAAKLQSSEISAFKLASAASAAFDVALLPEGRRPDRYDFAAFEVTLRERLPAVA
jgi:alkylated DNA repair dioxygenase AlkB